MVSKGDELLVIELFS